MDELTGRLSPELESRIRAEMQRLGATDMAKLLTPELDGVTGYLLFECLWEELGGYEAGQWRTLRARRIRENHALLGGSKAPSTQDASDADD